MVRALIAASLFALCAGANADAPPSKPGSEIAGFDAARLARIDTFLTAATGKDGYLGAVALVARHGQVVELRAFGHRDLARHDAMATDSIFRIYSMTKTITSIAVLMLMEEGRLGLDDPISDYLPAFAHMQVFAGGSADAPQLRPAHTPITIKHLLTHTAGFATAAGEEATRLLERADLHGARDLADFAQRASRVPLAVEPGTRFRYDGTQLEIASRIVEVVSGQPFDEFLATRIFAPLGMRDTGFSVPSAQRHRVVDISAVGADGRLVRAEGPSAREPGARLNAYSSGAGGLYSTATDYARLCWMLLQHGRFEGKSVLGRKTVELMMQNQLMPLDPPVTEFSPAEGFGLGGSILLDPARRGRLGSVGQFGWSGAASTYYTIDPREHLVAILLLQHLPGSGDHELPKLSTRFYNLVYGALQP